MADVMQGISTLGFLAARELARREGLPAGRVRELSLVGAIMGLTPLALVITHVVARREAPAPARVEETPTGPH